MPSTTPKMARTMAAAAHDPKFAKKMGIPQGVAEDFNQADTGTAMLSNAMGGMPKKPMMPGMPKKPMHPGLMAAAFPKGRK